MRTLLDCAGDARATTLLVLLPPANAGIDDLIQQGFVAAAREEKVVADILLAEITAEQVMNKTAMPALRDEVIMPAQTQGYRRIWLAGISLGAFNALHYVAAFADDIAGLILLAPYPGTGDILREINLAGGIDAWAGAPNRSHADERAWWYWLWNESKTPRAKPVYIGLGAGDRFIAGQRLLASLVAANNVDEIAGDHSWPIWQQLWQRWLARGLLTEMQSSNTQAGPENNQEECAR